MAKEIDQKYDILGQPINIGCHVAVARKNMIKICRIENITLKMVHVIDIDPSSVRGYNEFMVYPQCTVRLDGPDALAYILKS